VPVKRLAALLVTILIAFTAHGARANEIRASVTDDKGQPVEDAVVIAVPLDAVKRAPSRPREGVVDQVDKEFMPKVTVLLVGTSVTFPNHDNVRHQVYSFSPGKRFELPLYAGVPAQPIVFDKPGVVVLGCNIHDWMVGYVYVSESPYFAKTGKDGTAVLTDVPPRAYAVRVWHPQSEMAEDATRKDVDTSRAARNDVEWTLKLKSESRVRRAPTAAGRSRY